MIPKVFHQIWLGPDPLPAEFEPYQQSWQRHHPGWELRLWGEDNLPSELRRPEALDRERQPVERADILRLELIWRFGGVYLDTDFECLKPIDELLEGVDFFTGLMKAAGPSKPARVNNAIFGAVAGHPLLDRALDELRPHELGARYDKHLSGAMFFNALVLDDPGVTILPREHFYPATEAERGDAFAIHHAARLWHDVDGLRRIVLRAETRLEKTTQRLEKERRLRERDQRRHEEEKQKLEAEKRALEEQLAELRELRERRGRGLTILFFLRSIHFDRVFEPFLRALLERGHVLQVVLSTEKRGLPETKTRLFDELRTRYDFAYERLPRRDEPWLRTAVALRHALDYLRYLEPEFAHADPLRERARQRASRPIRMLLAVPLLRGPTGRRALRSVLRRLEAAIPVPRAIKDLIRNRRPDVVIVSPLVGMGSTESEYVRAAQALGVPTVLAVASWDNLTNKGVLRDVPTTTIVWNQAQVEEAVRLHDLPREQVVAVGAHSFDHWFGRSPSTTREEFARARGLDPDRPLLLYLGSSYFISGDETAFVRDWLSRVRAHPKLAEAAVILRPHPQNGVGWDRLEDEPGRTVVWPRVPTAPTDDEKRADYFDALSHANAVVGVNTSGMIEAAIVHRPVFTLISEHFTTQEGTLHFTYLADDDRHGPVTVARSWDEHLKQLAEAVEEQAVDHERVDAFLRSFVRPHGLDVPAAPVAADAVERAAATAVRRSRAPVLRPLLIALTPLAVAFSRISDTPRTWTARRRRKDRVRVATEVWREREQRLETKHDAKAHARAERERAREEKQRARAEKQRTRELAGAKPRKDADGRRRDAKQARTREKEAEKAAARAAKRRKAVGRSARRRWKTFKRGARSAYDVRYRFTYRSTIARVPSRDELPVVLNARGLVGRGAEIGVRDGRYSDRLLERWKGSLLISIDPWQSADPDAYVDRSNVSQEEFEHLYLETRRRLARHGARSEIWRMTSLEAAPLVPDGTLDFAYVDARHDYESVLEDLEAWFPKVKPGGILAGHDYVDIDFGRTDFGVKSAVDEFFAARGIPVHCTHGPSAVELFPSWIVEIPAHRGAGRNGRRPAPAAARVESR